MSAPVRIVRLDTGLVYPSAAAAGRALGASASDVCRAARCGIRVAGVRVAYADGDRPHATRRGRTAFCVETGEAFASVTQAARMLGAPRSQVSRCLRDTGRGVHGFHLSTTKPKRKPGGRAQGWESGVVRDTIREVYLHDAEAGRGTGPAMRGWSDAGIHVFNPDDAGYVPNGATCHDGRRVICLDTMRTFPSIASAATYAGVSPSSIARACELEGRAGGLAFCWENPQLPLS